ncbi:arginase family protein [Streptomyces sp. NBC_00441]|uniref:arginase family protein n=1 Tax=Streptomyces sp. NBC_00441 TaxID=2975742 RepID=UPI002E2C4A16|nr:arginase family protein [Streptomyces sp. NBC_00441]
MTTTAGSKGADRFLVTDPHLIRTAAREDGATYWNTSNGKRFAVGPSAALLLEQLRTPTAQKALVGPQTPPESLVQHSLLDQLHDLELIISGTEGIGPVAGALCPTPPAVGLFGCEGVSLAAALNDDSVHGVIVGMPYDVGTTGRPGARFGPQTLRGASRTIFRQSVPGDRSGMYDPVRGRRVLHGVGLADIGDVSAADVHERNGDTMDVLEQIVGATVAAGKFPVVLGGDHSISLPAIRGVLATLPKLGIIHFDAHPDYRRPRTDDWRASCHHGNFMGWLLGDPGVERLIQFGVRQLLPDEIASNDDVTVWPGVSAATATLDAVLADLPDDLPYYVTIDVDCLDPLVMPSTGTPLPGGFTHAQLVDLLDGLCRARRIVGVDLVEYMPDGNTLTGHVAADILLRALDSSLTGREQRPGPHRG